MNSTQLFEGRVAVIAGGARGIGKAYSQGFAAMGAAVVVADLRGERAQETAAEISAAGGRAIGVQVDVASEQSVRQLFEQAVAQFDRVDFLINNAAIMLDLDRPFKPFWETELQEWDRVMAVNTAGVFLCCKHVKPIMERQGGGRIVNITSDAIWKGYEDQLAYFASKGAVAIMNRCLARELGPFNINVNAIAPGYTQSEAVRESEFMQSVKSKVLASQCIKIEQQPEDVVGAAIFLCSPASRTVTGQTIVVNCGAIMP